MDEGLKGRRSKSLQGGLSGLARHQQAVAAAGARRLIEARRALMQARQAPP